MQPAREIDGTEIKAFIIGDPAYPIQDWLMKSFPAPATPEEESFGVYLSRARIVVENAFGRLKSRWRILQKKIDADIDFVPLIVATCCILHNIAENNKIPIRSSWNEALEESSRLYPQPIYRTVSNSSSLTSNAIREHLKIYMAQNFPLLQSRLL